MILITKAISFCYWRLTDHQPAPFGSKNAKSARVVENDLIQFIKY